MNSNNQIEFYLNSQQVDFIQMKLPQGFSLHLASLIHQREQRISKKFPGLMQLSRPINWNRQAKKIQHQEEHKEYNLKNKRIKRARQQTIKILQNKSIINIINNNLNNRSNNNNNNNNKVQNCIQVVKANESIREIKLRENIKQLKYEYLRGVWEIVQESVQANGDDEVEFDIDVLPTKTARKLEAYVTSRLQAKTQK